MSIALKLIISVKMVQKMKMWGFWFYDFRWRLENIGHSNPSDKTGELVFWEDGAHSNAFPLMYSLPLGDSPSDWRQDGRVGVLVPLPPPPLPVQDMLLPIVNDDAFTAAQ